MRNQITLAEVLDAHGFALLASVYKIMPGTVTAYHAASAGTAQPSVDVQPGVHDVRWDTALGASVSEPWPILPRVPLAMPKGGGFVCAFAMSPGDGVVLISFDLDPTAFRGSGNASPPIDTRRHGGGHWVALPCDITDGGAVADPGAFFVVGGATDFVALASKVDANFTAVKSEISKLTTAVNAMASVFTAAAGSAMNGVAVAAVAPPTDPPSVASALVKTK